MSGCNKYMLILKKKKISNALRKKQKQFRLKHIHTTTSINIRKMFTCGSLGTQTLPPFRTNTI